MQKQKQPLGNRAIVIQLLRKDAIANYTCQAAIREAADALAAAGELAKAKALAEAARLHRLTIE